MKAKLKTMMQQLLQSPRRFPVEAALGITFFIIAQLCKNSTRFNPTTCASTTINDDILFFFIPLTALSFWLQSINRKAYYASYFLFLPLMALDLESFVGSISFAFTYVLAGLLLIVGNGKLDNRSFSSHALHVISQTFIGMTVAGIFYLAVMAIIASFIYIFSIDKPTDILMDTTRFIWFVLTPQVVCTFVSQDEDRMNEPKVLKHILNYILSPGIIIYTVILYLYFIKIAVEWDLPKGGVAWMVMAFITVALAGRMAQSVLSQRYYEFFYRHFTFIAIPPLIMYWIGSTYRISLYSFTESRFYLMLAGILMTLFVFMLFSARTRRYQLMALIVGATIILFTYIPGISAKSIGLRCQQHRLDELITEMKLNDTRTGKLNDNIDVKHINKDSLMCEKYKEVCNVIQYVRKEIGREEFKKLYGEWSHYEYIFHYSSTNNTYKTWIHKKKPVELGAYNVFVPNDKYECSYFDNKVTVTHNDKTILEYPIDEVMSKNTAMQRNPELLLNYHNDSVMIVLDGIEIEDNAISSVACYDFMIFKKSKKGNIK